MVFNVKIIQKKKKIINVFFENSKEKKYNEMFSLRLQKQMFYLGCLFY